MMRPMPRTSTISRLAAIAEDQWGLVTRRQAQRAGVPHATLERLTAEGTFLERVAQGVYHLTGAPLADHVELRAAWLQLAPDVPAWERTADQGVVSHQSAAALYGLGDLPADRHEFTLPTRKRSRRPDVRLHRRKLGDREWIELRGLPVTRPSRMASDRLLERLYLRDEGWVVKGATALLAREIGVRGTRDIDVYREQASEVAESDLREAAS